jgi:dTDP-4-dehydrorhamnose 3,5-epimerase
MRLAPTPLAGAHVMHLQRLVDERGHFTRTFDAAQFAEHELEPTVVQCSVSHNRRAGTLRGLHFQAEPHAEAKLVRVVRGALFDVIVDLRPDSDTHRQWFGVTLTSANDLAVYVPPGFAHGFQTLVDGTEVLYQMSAPYVPGAACGVRWDDPAFGIDWPPAPPAGRVMSERDASYPDLVA